MGYRVRGALEISIFINGAEYPLEEINILNFFHCAESTKWHVPTMHFAILDVMGVMSKYKLGDSSSIDVVIKDSDIQTSMSFRAANIFRHPSGGHDLYEIDGFLNVPRYHIGTSSLGINGTSSAALSEICSLCDMKFSGIQTNDAQVWLPRNRSFCEFAEFIAARGFITDAAHIAMGIDLSGTMRYRDVRSPTFTARVSYNYATAGAYQAREFRPTTDSGFTNALSGYRDTRVAQSIYATKQHSELSLVPKVNNLLVNQGVRDAIKRGNFTYSPIDFGNVHPNCEKAKYQNARYDALLSLGGEFTFDHPTRLSIMDGLSLTTSPSASSEYDGDYIIGHKVIYQQGTSYAEKIIAFREGTS